MTDYSALACSLPENVMMYKYAGRTEDELRQIDFWLSRDIPAVMRSALLLEKDTARRLANEYNLTFDDALGVIRNARPDFSPEQLKAMMEDGRAEWRLVNNEVRFHEDFPAAAEIHSPNETLPPEDDDGKPSETDLTIKQMTERGSYAVRMNITHKMTVSSSELTEGELITGHLPLPIPTDTQSGIEWSANISGSEGEILAGPESADQRTVRFRAPYREGMTFNLNYAVTRREPYHRLNPDIVTGELPSSEITEDDLSEQYPHIRFTPFLRALEKELSAGETNPLIRARCFYDWMMDHLLYSYMRSYASIDNIAEFSAVNWRGDCGVQALLFITLCRIAGIPARWESSHSCKFGHIGSHDWARFYIAPYGWLFCDPTNGDGHSTIDGVSRRDFYFGHVDPRRIACNRRFMSPLSPEKKFDRSDPTDSQSGECESETRPLRWGEYRTKRTNEGNTVIE